MSTPSEKEPLYLHSSPFVLVHHKRLRPPVLPAGGEAAPEPGAQFETELLRLRAAGFRL